MLVCPVPSAVVAILEEDGEVNSHARFRNEFSPPGFPPLVGDCVMHDAVGIIDDFEAVLVNEDWEWAFDDCVY